MTSLQRTNSNISDLFIQSQYSDTGFERMHPNFDADSLEGSENDKDNYKG